jgi:hypothetical protein
MDSAYAIEIIASARSRPEARLSRYLWPHLKWFRLQRTYSAIHRTRKCIRNRYDPPFTEHLSLAEVTSELRESTDTPCIGKNSVSRAIKDSKEIGCPPTFHTTIFRIFNEMPAVPAPAKVLVTGANGFIAIWLVQTLLNRGYFVRGTVRSDDKVKHLKDIFRAYVDKNLFEVLVVPDITKVCNR